MVALRQRVLKAALGSPRTESNDERAWEVGQPHSTGEVAEQGRNGYGRQWREGGWPRGIGLSKTRSGLRAGQACIVRSDGYARQ